MPTTQEILTEHCGILMTYERVLPHFHGRFEKG